MELGAAAEAVCVSAGEDLLDTVDGVLHTHDVALWNGNDTSLSAPTTAAVLWRGRPDRGGRQYDHDRHDGEHRGWAEVDRLRRWWRARSFAVRPTAIYANPVLLDLIDREMKTEFNVVLNSREITGGFTVKMLSTQAGDLPLIPEWALSYTGTPGSGSALFAGVHRDGRT